ncbi:MAG: hypothetical protein WCJ62_09960 [Flavobacterium sp.]
MKKLLLCLLVFITFFSCQKKEDKGAVVNKDNSCSKEKKFEMYEMSEMASLMEQMYSYNKLIRNRIVKGDTLGKFPQFFNKIYSAKFTTPSDNDDFFKANAKKFIEAQKRIYEDPKNEKANFNKGLDACISCHQGKCGGPIPRIKKLYIP